jgi:hypothetical protein
LPPFDYHCPLLSLPLAFGTRLETIPADIPYVFSDSVRVGEWRDRLGKKTRPRIGVAWSGQIWHKNDRNRSVPLSQIAGLGAPHAEFISLQKDLRPAEKPLLLSRPEIRHFGDEFKDFADTAALVDLVDLVISVDTSVAHLAGAMGKPVWVLLPYAPDWRWMLDREDSLWYPTARLFRQPAVGDWTSVFNRLQTELAARFAPGPSMP